jgi:hypothetical protein
MPAGTEQVLVMLQRYLDNRGDTEIEQKYKAALDKMPNARATVARIVERYEANRTQLLGGRTAPNTKGQLDVKQINASASLSTGAAVYNLIETLPPEPDKVSAKAYELRYEGLKCRKTVDTDGNGDEPLVYAAVLTPNNAQSFDSATFVSPQLSAIQNGATNTSGNASVFSGAKWPVTGAVLVSALLEDNGGSAAVDKQKLDAMIEAAKIYVTLIDDADRTKAIDEAIKYHVWLLKIGDPVQWADKTVSHTIVTAKNYDDYFMAQPKTMDAIPYKLDVVHDTRGGDYSLLFNTPSASITKPPLLVTVTVEKLENTGSEKDLENGVADMAIEGSIRDASLLRALQKNKNEITSDIQFHRHVFPGAVGVVLKAVEIDAAPDKHVWYASGPWGSPGAHVWCGSDVNDPPPAPPGVTPVAWKYRYKGPCQPKVHALDIAAAGATELQLSYDPATGTIKQNGTVIGQKGQSITRTGADPKRAAKITFKISHK